MSDQIIKQCENFIKNEKFKNLDSSEYDIIINYFTKLVLLLNNRINLNVVYNDISQKTGKKYFDISSHFNEIVLMLFPFIKNQEEFTKIKHFSNILTEKTPENFFKYSNLQYNICNSKGENYILSSEELIRKYYNFNVLNIDKVIFRLMPNWFNIYPYNFEETNDYKIFNITKSNLFILSIEALKKNNYDDTDFLQFNDKTFKEFDNYLENHYYLPVSVIYDSLNYIKANNLEKILNNLSENSNDDSQSIIGNKIIEIIEKLIKNTFLKDKKHKIIELFKQNSKRDFSYWMNLDNPTKNNFIHNQNFKYYVIIAFILLFMSGTLSCFCYNENFINYKIKFYKNYQFTSITDIKNQFENDEFISFLDSYYFLNNSTYRNYIQTFKDFVDEDFETILNGQDKDENNKLVQKIRNIKKEKSLEKFEDAAKNFILSDRKYKVQKWIKTNDSTKPNDMLYSAEIFPQIQIYVKFINCRVLFITGETGTGKSTQFPINIMYALKAFDYNITGSIIDTQPRKNPTSSNTGAISTFTGLFVPILSSNPYVQYKTGDSDIHLESEIDDFHKHMMIRFVTDRILLNELKTYPLLRYKNRNLYDCVVIDEAHEHNVNMDFILTFMKNIVYFNNTIRLFIVSATMDDDEPRYRQYYRFIEDNYKYPINNSYLHQNKEENNINLQFIDRRIHISNPDAKLLRYKKIQEFVIDDKTKRMNEIEEKIFSKPDKKLMDEMENINNERTFNILQNILKKPETKNVLIFKAGQGEIVNCLKYLLNKKIQEDTLILPWFSSASEGLKNILDTIQKDNIVSKIKIDRNTDFLNPDIKKESFYNGSKNYNHIVFIATNIVEASVTIVDLSHVIDDGMQKISMYDYETGSTILKKVRITEQSRLQRYGRVGRVADGYAYFLYEHKKTLEQIAFFKICIEDIKEIILENLECYDVDENNSFSINNDEPLSTIKQKDITVLNNKNKEITINFNNFFNNHYKIIDKINQINENFEFDNDLNQNFDNSYTSFKYDLKGYSFNTLNDKKYNFYIVHPNESFIGKRDILGNPINQEILKEQKDFINYYDEYLFKNILIIRDKKLYKTEFYYKLDRINSIFSEETLELEFINLPISSISLLLLLSSFYNFYDYAIEFIYCCLFFNKCKNISPIIRKYRNYSNDFNYLRKKIKQPELCNEDEIKFLKDESFEKFKSIFTKESVINILKECYDYLIPDKIKTFDQILVICFFDKIYKIYKNPNYNANMFPDFKYSFINITKPTPEEIHCKISSTVYETYSNSNLHEYVIGLYKSPMDIPIIGFLIATNKTNLRYLKLYYDIQKNKNSMLENNIIQQYNNQLFENLIQYIQKYYDLNSKQLKYYNKNTLNIIFEDLKNEIKNGIIIFNYKHDNKIRK
jgi:hypothetical protein